MMRIFLVVLIGCLSASLSTASQELPCNILDSVDITNGIRQPDGSILYGGVMYTIDQYATVDYIVKKGVKKFDDFTHIRGCPCHIKPCLRFCCPFETPITRANGTSCMSMIYRERIKLEIWNDFRNETLNLRHQPYFAYVDGYPCSVESMYPVDNYHVSRKGEIFHENRYLTHQNYCFYIDYIDIMDLGSNMGLGPRVLICQPAASPPQYTIDPLAYDILPITSAVLVIVTLLIYACIPKLHTLQGKCIIFYLIVLAIGCILTAHLAINDRRYGDYVTPNMCRLIGFILLISLLSSFLWLNVLNFNMWLSVYPTERFKHWTNTAKLQLYAVYGFGAPYIWTLIVYILDGFGSKLPLIFRPGSGEKSCFLNNMFLYFHFPCAITLIFNLILFVSIYISNRQYKVRHEQDLKLADENINRELLAGLSLVTGIILMIEIFAYLLIADSFEILLICIAVQGIIVFILFVLNCRVRSSIKERWQEYNAKRNSNRKNASNAPMNEISSS